MECSRPNMRTEAQRKPGCKWVNTSEVLMSLGFAMGSWRLQVEGGDVRKLEKTVIGSAIAIAVQYNLSYLNFLFCWRFLAKNRREYVTLLKILPIFLNEDLTPSQWISDLFTPTLPYFFEFHQTVAVVAVCFARLDLLSTTNLQYTQRGAN